MVSVRFASVIFLAAFMASSTVQGASMAKPYSPDLYARDALMAESDATPSIGLVKRVQAAKPYAPDLFSRQSLEDNDEDVVEEKRSTVVKRSVSPAAKATWSLFKRATEESEEDLHERGLVDDAQIEARGGCDSDWQCGSDHYCSSKRNKCYRKIHDYNRCSRDGACGSGYCCESESICKPKRDNGDRCHGNDSACDSDYCSVVSDRCHHQSGKGDGCRVDQGCKGDLSCVNGTCKNSGSSQPSKPHHPSHPAPSGSARQRRALSPL
ncbi:uncharacterized protein FA14DRAFT_81747 [Meira miltonrushii]|uniref:Dickkopf N-terminal cysteine-rich domain-containing protein n=1 Tax=Meira miltonrushii TaxID=1280837 RepID=A0A316V6Q2_9BASI|nr:uncharacterized protein FA14DRAFT_81747 [Meira miltonrushii]PWN31873.1 hypothetical protein FA14DRAFT_81747 [Meira miltonrushii]